MRLDDDPRAGPQLPALPSVGRRRRLEYRRLCRAFLQPRGHDVGTVAAGRIGTAALRRLKPFDVKVHYTGRHRLPDEVEKELALTFHRLVKLCDLITINVPLHLETKALFNDALIAKMKRGAYTVNTARGKIRDRDVIVRALKSGQLAGYAGDVWFPQPAPRASSPGKKSPQRHRPNQRRHCANYRNCRR